MDNGVFEYRVTVQWTGMGGPTGWEEAERPSRHPELYQALIDKRNARSAETGYVYRLERAPVQDWEPVELASVTGVASASESL